MSLDETTPPREPASHDAPTTGGMAGGAANAADGLPTRIGRYEIKKLIAGGGMGVVYLAVQDHPRRTVALKVMRAGIASRAALRRFEYESQLLGRLRHPGIAQIYEAGAHEENGVQVPYFAMEYVAGAKWLCDDAEDRKLGVRDRLELFVRVCEAMQHAHQKGIIHRDLKPANILVDSGGQPKIIDFGVARGADSDLAGVTLQTNVGQLVGTIQYMSPEQCGADPHNVDVRSDVYALGVVLYELLAHRLPYEISTKSVPDAARTICETTPARPSTVNHTLRGDLETIVLKSLEKERERRYQSVADLAADIGRFMRNEPILARPVGPLGRLSKWAKRNREAALIGTIAAVLLAAISAVSLVRIVDAKRQAERNLMAAQQNFNLVRGMLHFRDAEGESLIKQGQIHVKRLLDEAAASLSATKPEFPTTEADFREILGIGYTELGLFSKAKENLGRSLEIRTQHLPPVSAGIGDALHHLAVAMFRNGEYEPARAAYQRSLEIRRKLKPGDDRDVGFSLTHLAACALEFDETEEAERLYREALEMRRRLHPTDHEDVAASLNNLAKLYMERGRYSEAEPLFRQSLEMIRGLKGNGNVLVSHALHNLAACLLEAGRYPEAGERFAQALEIRLEEYGPDGQRVAGSRLGIARAQLAQGNLDAAESQATEALRICRGALRENHPDTADALAALGEVLMARGDPAKAEPLLREAVDIARGAQRPRSTDMAVKQGSYGECLRRLGRDGEAEPLLTDSFQALRTARGDAHRQTVTAARRLADLYAETNRPDKAAELAAIIAKADPAAPRPERR